jgi:hypothetical protein
MSAATMTVTIMVVIGTTSTPVHAFWGTGAGTGFPDLGSQTVLWEACWIDSGHVLPTG